VDSILRQAREEFDSVFAASEGMVITLGAPGDKVKRTSRERERRCAAKAQFHAKSLRRNRKLERLRGRDHGPDVSLQGALIR